MKKRTTKYIFVTGGVVSSLGKGLTSASLAALLESRGLQVTMCKMDPYLNVDPGTMSPFQHGEVFVTIDGAETDLDLGHYERFLNCKMTKKNCFTSGLVYETIIANERKGEYLGKTIQVVPHVTNEIKRRVCLAGEGTDVFIGEIGGTVGDIESLPFLEAIRQMRTDVGRENVLYIHVALVPYIAAAGELKTKPTQHSVKELTSLGIQPDIIVLRSSYEVDAEGKEKIALFCNIEPACVVNAPDVKNIYYLPLVLHDQSLDLIVCEKLNIWTGRPNLKPWENVTEVLNNPKNGTVKIAMVGKYVDLKESYKSVSEALTHGGIANNCKVEVEYVDSETITEDNQAEKLAGATGILVPGGFGVRGTEGKISMVHYAREHKIPFFGICLGLQMAVIEFARYVAKLDGASSTEFDKETPYPVIDLMEHQREVVTKGATMRLGEYPCVLVEGTLAHEIYGKERIDERHRHRYEVNNKYRELLASKGLIFSGLSPDNKLVEMLELRDHPWFIGVQFHPEFGSKPLAPHPLFASFIQAALKKRKS
ncbi:MAG: CTP synthase [Deltaproteobacteria bacterium]|jgi:CTP synthase|nr:CTP synthase [Deltaproteobacteria bacterium]